MGELYGDYNLLTNEWADGLASSIIRAAVSDTTLDRKWVVFDGPVDPLWIENMNTGEDDSYSSHALRAGMLVGRDAQQQVGQHALLCMHEQYPSRPDCHAHLLMASHEPSLNAVSPCAFMCTCSVG